jgi:hypothetical protein
LVDVDQSAMPALAAIHGTSLRGLAPGLGSGGGRFGRMFPLLPPAPEHPRALIDKLLVVMKGISSTGQNETIPAGYTYVGQFVDHDVTFDPNSRLAAASDPGTLVNFRTPRLDLDSVYGSGPADQPYLYDWGDPEPGARLLIGRSPGPTEGSTIDDLPRNRQGRALIGDPRNDVHLIIAQLHLLFIRFHNAVVERVRSEMGLSGPELFLEANRLVRWHYQWLVTHDYLRHVVGKALAKSILRTDLGWPVVDRRFFHFDREPYIPVEFSVAAFRFGHSMVRESYRVNDEEALSVIDLTDIRNVKIVPFLESADPDKHLAGLRFLPPNLRILWKHFFPLTGDPVPKPSMKIDSSIAVRLSTLPAEFDPDRVLPLRNLLRGQALGLPAGLAVARTMGAQELTGEQLLPADETHNLEPAERTALLDATPLWYYILREASELANGERLGPVGGRIVAEVLVGLVEGDPQSYLRVSPPWTPADSAKLLGRQGPGLGDFTMVDLIRYVGADVPYDAPVGPVVPTP